MDADWVSSVPAPTQGRASTTAVPKRKVRLDGTDDDLFHDLRDDNFAIVGEKLHHVAKRISQDYQGRHQAHTVDEIRAFVSRLGNLQSEHASLRLHTCMTEHLLHTTKTERFHRILEIQQNLVEGVQLTEQLAVIEELVWLHAPVWTVLRLICMACIVGVPIRAKWLDTFRTAIVQTYGPTYLPLLLALEKLQILVPTLPPAKGARTSRFRDLQKPLHLVDDTVDERDPGDIGYVFSGYAPLSIRLVQLVCQHESVLRARKKTPGTQPRAARIAGWRNIDDAVANWPGTAFDIVQDADKAPFRASGEGVKTTMVFFVGGVTYAEIAALRLMNAQQQGRCFVVATTSVVNGQRLLQQCCPGR